MKNIKKLLACLGLLLAFSVGASQAAYASVAGHVQFISGDVQSMDSLGRMHALKKGDAVSEGDTLITAASSTAQIKMEDGGFIAVRANTRMKFEQFKFSGKADGTERDYLSLVKGGFRSVTGLIGHANKENYRVTTPAATVGIRGTDYEVVYEEASKTNVALADLSWMVVQADVPAPIVRGGFAAAVVNKGAIEMGTNRGKTLLQPGQGMVISFGMNQLPVIKPIDTSLFPGSKPSAGGKGGDSKKDDTATGKDGKGKNSGGDAGDSGKKSGGGTESKSDSSASTGSGQSGGGTDTTGGSTSSSTGTNGGSAQGGDTAPIRTTTTTDTTAPGAGLGLAPSPNPVVTIAPVQVAAPVVVVAPPPPPKIITVGGTPINVAAQPTLASCTVAPATAGCAAILPTLATCTATPATAGCTAVLPTIATCTATPATAGCTAVLPTIATCTATPATAGCTAVLPTLATCTATPATAGCTAVLPTIATCTATPTAAGCTAVLPTIATCSTNPAAAGCTVVLPVQPYVQKDVSMEVSSSAGTVGGIYMPMYFGANGIMTAAANVAPLANPPSFLVNYGCVTCGSFSVQLPGATGAINANATSFATTGIQFGRWTSVPSISQSSSYPFAPGLTNVGSGGSTWAYAPEGYLDTPTTLSAATGGTAVGVFNYTLNGAPAPKNQNGTSGTLNSMSLAANFTTQTITAALSVSLGTTTYTGTSPAMTIGAFNGTSGGFNSVLTVTSSATCAVAPCSNLYGYLNGAFTGQNYAGAIVDYNIQDWPLTGGAMTANLNGVAALTRNGVTGNATVTNGTVPATGKFVVAQGGMMTGNFVQTVNTVATTATTGGTVLTGFSTNAGVGNTSSTTISCTTCTGQAATDTATGIQFGTWDTGTNTNTYTSPFGGQIHWITGPGLDPIYLPEVLLGTMSYALDGGTAPTNQNGVAGTLNSASLKVDFTAQTVNLALGVTANGHTWTATTTGSPLSWTNYSKNGFFPSSGTGLANAMNVTMDGVAVTGYYGYISGQLTGSGLNGALFQYQLSAPLSLPAVPSTFTATDTLTSQAPSMTVTGVIGGVTTTLPAGVGGTLAPVAATTLNVALTAGVPTSATLSGGAAGTVSLTAVPSITGSYTGVVGGNYVAVDTMGYLVTNSGNAGGLRYSNFGEWRMRPDVVYPAAPVTGAFTIGEFAGGMLLTTAMPVSNTINTFYSGSMNGRVQDSATNTIYGLNNGFVSLNANFATGTLNGTVTYISVLDSKTKSIVGYFNDLTFAATVTTNAYSGTVTAGAVPTGFTPVDNVPVGTVGSASGHFYGPAANESTGIFGLTSGTIQASGAFGVANGTSGTVPVESVNGVVALVASPVAGDTAINAATPYRLVGMSTYDPAYLTNPVTSINGGMVVDGGYNNATRVATDAAGNVTAFDTGLANNANIASTTGTVGSANSSTVAIGTATVAARLPAEGTGTDPVTGISWGRWAGGSVNITNRTTGVVTPSALGTANLHWISAPVMTGPVALPTTGTYNYVLAGGTAPTDNLGNVGVLKSATLSANFAAQTVSVGVNVGITNASGAATLNASATNVPIQQRSMFGAATTGISGNGNGLLTATCAGAGCGTAPPPVVATINGAFTGATGQGAAMVYGFVNNGSVVNGVAAFHR